MNLRAALDFLVETRHAEWAMRMGAALLPFWHARAHLVEGRDRLTRILQLGDPLEISELRARATFALATLVYSVGEPGQSGVLHNTEVLRIYRALGDRRRAAVALNGLGVAQRGARDYPAARRAFEEALSIWRDLGDAQAAARTLSNLAAVAVDERDYDRARRLYDEVCGLFDDIGDAGGAAWTMTFEAQIEEARGDREAARALYDRALGQFRRIHDAWGTGEVLLALGHMDADDRLDSARTWFEQAYAVFSEARDMRGIVRVIEAFARLAADRRDADRALTLSGAAAALRRQIGVPQPHADRRRLERALAAVRLGPDAQGAGPAWMNGWSMSSEQAIEYAVGATARPAI
jgi:tetratricopeptide (TPR) repeat protein